MGGQINEYFKDKEQARAFIQEKKEKGKRVNEPREIETMSGVYYEVTWWKGRREKK